MADMTDNISASPLALVIFYGSVRSARIGIHLARFVHRVVAARGHQVIFVDPHDYNFGLLDRMYKEYTEGKAPSSMRQLAATIENADGFLVVSGEYNHSIPPALSNLMDHFLEEYFYRPSSIITYSAGIYGGVRAAMQLRAFLAEIGTVSLPTLLGIPRIESLFDEQQQPLDPKLKSRITGVIEELEWYAQALRSARSLNPLS